MITLLIYVILFMIVLAIVWYVSGLLGLPQNVRIIILLILVLLLLLGAMQGSFPDLSIGMAGITL